MRELGELFDSNQRWAKEMLRQNPQAFLELAKAQTPKYLWIGCSDSRVPANEILGLPPGALFVHRNIANLFPHTDFNCLSVLQYAVDYLKIDEVIVCGHYGCGGIAAAMDKARLGIVDNWLRHVRDIHAKEKHHLDSLPEDKGKYNRLVELNVLYQVMNVCHTSIVQDAWADQRKLNVHGWVYDISTGILKDLNCCVSSLDQVDEVYHLL